VRGKKLKLRKQKAEIHPRDKAEIAKVENRFQKYFSFHNFSFLLLTWL